MIKKAICATALLCVYTTQTLHHFDDTMENWLSHMMSAPMVLHHCQVPDLSNQNANIMEDEYLITIEIKAPGFKKEELAVSLDERRNLLTVTGTKTASDKEEDTAKRYIRHDFQTTNFQTNISLIPVRKETVVSTFADGILSIILEKTQKPEATKIEIQ